MSRVFVLEAPKFDVSRAAQFGKLEYIFEKGMSRPSIWDDEFITHVIRRLRQKNFDSQEDYFLIVGHMVSMALVVAALVHRFKSINLLLFSAAERSYIPKKVGDNGHTSTGTVRSSERSARLDVRANKAT